MARPPIDSSVIDRQASLSLTIPYQIEPAVHQPVTKPLYAVCMFQTNGEQRVGFSFIARTTASEAYALRDRVDPGL